MPSFLRAISLVERTTFGVGGSADYFSEISDEDDLERSIDFAQSKEIPFFVLGSGSNVLISDAGFRGLVIHTAILRYEDTLGETCVRISVGAGEIWDDVVARSVSSGWSGLECLSGIPGTVGAAPVQNIGAYGVSVAPYVVTVRAYDTQKGIFVEFEREECAFGYRESMFKRSGGRYIISRVTCELQRKKDIQLPAYHDIQNYFSDQKKEVSSQTVRAAVLDIRKKKGMVIPSEGDFLKTAGSFFKNPVVSQREYEIISQKIDIQEQQAHQPWFWKLPEEKIKIAAAFLMEQAGFKKGYRIGKVGLSSYHALALVNYGGASARDIVSLAREIQNKVFQKYGVILEPEVQCIGFDEYPFLKIY
ncbi:UDP-N-acetylmuramate dehydrogenase [Candidatus Uhrbacteria bacterium]|nr:UDP-N-acetylmuramate dehydrogenase [Candidatus Uhrbacteria bacterium]